MNGSGAAQTVLVAGGGSGGHLMPALAIAGGLRERNPDRRIVLVGARRGVEAKLLPSRDYPFHLLDAEPIYRRQWWRNVKWPILAVRLVRAVGRLLDAERPGLVLGTGGYASGPVVWMAARRGIPTAVLEQDAVPGLTTRWLAGRVGEIYLGVPDAQTHLRPGSGTTVVVTGSPIIPPDATRRPDALRRYGCVPGRPVLLVTGGGQGAQAINEVIAEWIRSAPAEAPQVIWSTGHRGGERYRSLHAPPDVHVEPFLEPIADAYAVADFAVTRAGMMTVAELAAWGIPAILIPLPTSAADHQRHNAVAHAAAGAGVLLEQQDLTMARLGQAISLLAQDPARRATMAEAARSRGRPAGLEAIVDRLVALDRGAGLAFSKP